MISLRNFARNSIPLLNAARNYSTGEKLVNISVNDKNGIATVTMQRPPVNGLNLELLTDLSNAFDEVDSNKSRGMILTSACDKVFCAGLDLMEIYKPKPERFKALYSTLQDVWIKLSGSPFPTVAVINGHAPAGGCMLSLSCEYRVMVKNFTIGLNESKVGVSAPDWLKASFTYIIGVRQAELSLTTGKLFTTDDAFNAGMVDQIAYDKADALVKGEEFFKRFTNVHPLARQLTKSALRSKDLKELMDNREEDFQKFWSSLILPNVQKNIGDYIQALKKK